MHADATDVTRSVVCVSVSLLVCLRVIHTGVLCKKRLNRSRCRLGMNRVSPRNHAFDRGQDRTNLFAAVRGDKTAMQPFARLPWTLIIGYLHIFSWLL